MTPRPGTIPFALVHHANQYLITNGYDNRQGIAEIVAGYTAVLRLHEHLGAPANLHLSGTLLEAIAWHEPRFLAYVKHLRASGLIALVGGTYAENVMPIWPPAFNLRALAEHLALYQHYLDCSPEEVTMCWIPERVWDTAQLGPVLTSPRLANGGYRFVLLDDRLRYPLRAGQYRASPRATFDNAGPFHPATRGGSGTRPCLDIAAQQPYRIAGAQDLTAVPISAHLRYWIPPTSQDDRSHLRTVVRRLAATPADGAPGLLVYADDLEKTAGVGGWDPMALDRYASFLRWVAASDSGLAAVHLPAWLAAHSPSAELEVDSGTFYELGQDWRAGEDYRGWWADPLFARHRDFLSRAQEDLHAAEWEDVDRPLLDLAWKHLLASGYETAWHDPSAGGRGPAGRSPAPWARALASHARAAHVITAAARWFARPDHARRVSAVALDVDRDGESEVVLRNEHLYAVLSPAEGGRLVYLFARTERGGVLLVGTPTDDWNFQEDLNQYMRQPPNHPGALADVGQEHDRYRLARHEQHVHAAVVELVNTEPTSPLAGARKQFALTAGASVLGVCYQVPGRATGGTMVEACLSPDYYRLLRYGRAGVRTVGGACWNGVRRGEVAVWVALASDEATDWGEPARAEVGHGFVVRVHAAQAHFHLALGAGSTSTSDAEAGAALNGVRELLHAAEVEREPWLVGASRDR